MVISEDDLPDAFDMFVHYDGTPEYYEKVKKYGISRKNKDFWKHYDWFQKSFDGNELLEAGLYDLSRYYKQAW